MVGPGTHRELFPLATASGRAPSWGTKNPLGVEAIGQHPQQDEGYAAPQAGYTGHTGDGGQCQAQPNDHLAGPQERSRSRLTQRCKMLVMVSTIARNRHGTARPRHCRRDLGSQKQVWCDREGPRRGSSQILLKVNLAASLQPDKRKKSLLET